jgi:magnesium-transporting ATPase (P-type)
MPNGTQTTGLRDSLPNPLVKQPTCLNGLTSEEARRRLAQFGRNQIRSESRTSGLGLFLAQFKSPIILILIGAAIISFFLQDETDATLILLIVLVSGFLGFWQEYGATHAVAKLRAMVEAKLMARCSSAPGREFSFSNTAENRIVGAFV